MSPISIKCFHQSVKLSIFKGKKENTPKLTMCNLEAFVSIKKNYPLEAYINRKILRKHFQSKLN